MENKGVKGVTFVGDLSETMRKSVHYFLIWDDKERLINAVWEEYNNKTLERLLETNRNSTKKYHDTELINWWRSYGFFPSLWELRDVNVEEFFRQIEEPYNYNISFVLEHYGERGLIFDDNEMGLGSWDLILSQSLCDFASYSEKATLLSEKMFNLGRFLHKQELDYEKALQEIKSGKKISHWMWYIFPQRYGLGKSEMSKRFGLNGCFEPIAYIKHKILGPRLIEITQAVLDNEKTPYEIFGQDVVKFRACMILFASSCDEPIFKQACQKYNWII